MKGSKAEWRGRAHFSEIAEVLGISTELVMAALLEGDGYLVYYSPDYPSDEEIYSVHLTRDSSGVLVSSSVPRAHPGMWEKLKKGLEALDE